MSVEQSCQWNGTVILLQLQVLPTVPTMNLPWRAARCEPFLLFGWTEGANKQIQLEAAAAAAHGQPSSPDRTSHHRTESNSSRQEDPDGSDLPEKSNRTEILQGYAIIICVGYS